LIVIPIHHLFDTFSSREPGSASLGAWELEQSSRSFDAALKALTNGIQQRDTAILGFLGAYID
jgi:hypothetical protein